MDEQDKQDIQKKQRDLLLEIACCEIAKERVSLLIHEKGEIDLKSHDCNAVCKFQYDIIQKANGSKQEVTKAMFHVPEPWNGDLKTAEILFVSSNPSIDLDEKKFPKFESEEWSEDKKDGVVDFFSKRLESYKNNYWTGIRKYTAWILEVTDPSWAPDKENEEDKIKEIASRVALTEIVHCKSEKECGASEAAKTCFEKYTKKVIEYFLKTRSASGNKKTVVFIGGLARNTVCNQARTDKVNVDREKIAEYFGVSDENARFLCFPHPGVRKSWKTWNSGKVKNFVGNERKVIIKEIINKELEQYGYSQPSY